MKVPYPSLNLYEPGDWLSKINQNRSPTPSAGQPQFTEGMLAVDSYS